MTDSSINKHKILQIFSSILNRPVYEENNFFDLGGDSLEMSDIVYHINETYKTEFKAKEFLVVGEIKDMIDIILNYITTKQV